MLEHIIDWRLKVPWFSVYAKGAIFLVEQNPEVLVLKTQFGLDLSQQTLCARVPFGHCLCGRAALGRIMVTPLVDQVLDLACACLPSGRHYCLPLIMAEDQVLGVVMLFTTAEHSQRTGEEDFLQTAAQVMVGIPQRKQAEEKLRSAYIRIDQILASISLVLIGVDGNWRFTQWNSIAEQTYGLPAGQLIGQPFRPETVPWEWQPPLDNFPETIGPDQSLRLDNVRFWRHNGKKGEVRRLVSATLNRKDRVSSRAALSTCYPLPAYLKTKHFIYTPRPIFFLGLQNPFEVFLNLWIIVHHSPGFFYNDGIMLARFFQYG